MVIPAWRECIIKTTGFLGGLFLTPLYHLHPCRRAFAGMTGLPVQCHSLQHCCFFSPSAPRFPVYPRRPFCPLRHSGESRNPVVYLIHSRASGNDNQTYHSGQSASGRRKNHNPLILLNIPTCTRQTRHELQYFFNFFHSSGYVSDGSPVFNVIVQTISIFRNNIFKE